MKAVVNRTYGSPDMLEYTDVETPTPGDDVALIKIHPTGLNAYDWHLLRADPFLVRLSFDGIKDVHTFVVQRQSGGPDCCQSAD